MSCAADVVIVGAGPAGTAAAISCALRGLRVTLVERQRFPRHRPGETLPPGVEAVLRQLGVAEDVAGASVIRHDGIAVNWAGRATTMYFGGDEGNRWLGYQVSRADLDHILLARASTLGVDVRQPVTAEKPILREGRVVGAVTSEGPCPARLVVDGTGGVGWLRRRLGLGLAAASPPLRAYYGYCAGRVAGDRPEVVGDKRGWTWTAPIGPDLIHWTRLTFTGRGTEPPAALAGRPVIGRVRCADVTWRLVSESAGPGYFLVGEASAVLDPAASHGVLRALLSGTLAAHIASAIVSGAVPERAATDSYRRWAASWFHHDARRLSSLYRELDASWPGVTAVESSETVQV